MPDWDDRVDPGYDFTTDRPTLGRDPYADDVYAHELLGERAYDGILVSRMALGETGPKHERVNRVGMRAYLRLPPSLALLGDCGAYGYVRASKPRFETADVLEYYQRLGFDYGVSVDHLIVREVENQKHVRYELTLKNAEQLLRLHRSGSHRFTPIAAVQGWDVKSYVDAARHVVSCGYDYLALGGLARSSTREVGAIVEAVRDAIPASVRVHVFGIARLALLPLFLKVGVTSVDSASALRQAWLSARDNYHTRERAYAAIRIPKVDEERAKQHTLVGRSKAPLYELEAAEKAALAIVRSYDRGKAGLHQTLKVIMGYDRLLAGRVEKQALEERRVLYRDTLRDRPWAKCPCPICQEIGVEVIIFRGNNRNRRRGFHNLWTLHQRVRTRLRVVPRRSSRAAN